MDVREKLVELCKDLETLPCCDTYEGQAEYLIAHGVTVQEGDGCEYCKGEFIGENPIVSLRKDCGIDSIVEGEFLYNFCNCGIKSVVEINFCPMCGRRLSQQPAEDIGDGT